MTTLTANVFQALQQFRAKNGVDATPGYSFVSDTSTGLELSNGSLHVVSSGSKKLSISSTSVSSTLPYLAPDGTAGTPSYSFSSDPTTGLYRDSSSSAMSVAVSGVKQMDISSTGVDIKNNLVLSDDLQVGAIVITAEGDTDMPSLRWEGTSGTPGIFIEGGSLNIQGDASEPGVKVYSDGKTEISDSNQTEQLIVGTGTTLNPSIEVSNLSGYGINFNSPGSIDFIVNGDAMASITSGGFTVDGKIQATSISSPVWEITSPYTMTVSGVIQDTNPSSYFNLNATGNNNTSIPSTGFYPFIPSTYTQLSDPSGLITYNNTTGGFTLSNGDGNAFYHITVTASVFAPTDGTWNIGFGPTSPPTGSLAIFGGSTAASSAWLSITNTYCQNCTSAPVTIYLWAGCTVVPTTLHLSYTSISIFRLPGSHV